MPLEWQTLPLLVNPLSLNFVAVVLLAEIRGRCRYFLSHLRLRPMEGSLSLEFEVEEVLDLQGVRESARRRRNLRAELLGDLRRNQEKNSRMPNIQYQSL